MTTRLSAVLARHGIDVIVVPSMPQAMAMEMNSIDVAVVDSLVERPDEVCRRISRLAGIPVVLAVGADPDEWERFQLLDVDGYIPEGAGDAEIAARLRAVVRRLARVEPVGQESSVSWQSEGPDSITARIGEFDRSGGRS